jgi:hypothetical protein
VIQTGCSGVIGGVGVLAVDTLSGAARCDVQFNRNVDTCTSVIQPSPIVGSWLYTSQTLTSTTQLEQIGFSFFFLNADEVAVTGFDPAGDNLLFPAFGRFKLLVYC